MSQRTLRILMIHGYVQSGRLFKAKTAALHKTMQKMLPDVSIQFSYPTGPQRVQPADLPAFLRPDDPPDGPSLAEIEAAKSDEESDMWGWWIRKGAEEATAVYMHMDEGFARIAEVLQNEGPFDGVIGFSQGGAMAAMIASLLEPGRKEQFENAARIGQAKNYPSSFVSSAKSTDHGGLIHPPMKFAVVYSGFAPSNRLYRVFYEPKITTPTLHFLGNLDTVVSEERSLRVYDACTEGRPGQIGRRIVRHPGGHFLPSTQKPYVSALVEFIKDVMGWQGEAQKSKAEPSAEDMEMPF